VTPYAAAPPLGPRWVLPRQGGPIKEQISLAPDGAKKE